MYNLKQTALQQKYRFYIPVMYGHSPRLFSTEKGGYFKP